MARKKTLNALTSLKGIFCLIIALHNTMLIYFLFDRVPGMSFIQLFGGTMGNSLFFMISGFLFAYHYRERIRLHEVSFRDVLLRRLVKLYPLYILANAVSLLVNLWLYGPSAINLSKIAMILLLQSYEPYNMPTWFIAALFTCYVVFYGISYATKNKTQYLYAVVFFVLVGISLKTELPFLSARNRFAYMNFFTGCIFAELYPMLVRKNNRWLHHVCFVLLAGIAYMFLKYGVEIISGDVNLAFTFVVSPLIMYLALADGLYSKVLQIRPLVGLGNISTFVYFWHLPLYYVFCGLLSGETIQEKQYVLYVVLLIALSTLSWKCMERNQQRAAKKC